MEPSYNDGSILLINKGLIKFRIKERDVVLALDPRDRRPILKRVTKVSGEEIFLEGDNADESTDSRAFGLVQKGNIIGKVILEFPSDTRGWLKIMVPILAFLGLIDSAYLTIKHFTGGEVNCSAIPGIDCDIVLGSMYSEIFGIPLALLGSLYYLTVLAIGIIYLKKQDSIFIQFLLVMTSVGLLASLYLVYVQAFILNAYCAFCLASAFISTLLFASSLAMTFLKEKNTSPVQLK
ncbi:MAG: S26 family signal peptidase [Candidatus Colwellbacteria bacterium]|nr:S26 family signal peptidase [Candidatus Colwellbacteria bacterium]